MAQVVLHRRAAAWSQQVSRTSKALGARLEEFQRQQQEEDFNLNVLLANMVEGVMVVDQKHVVRLVNDELLNLFDLKQSPLGRTVLESLREARVEMIVRETIQQRRAAPAGGRSLESTALGQPPRHFDISVVPIRTKKDEVGGAVVVFHDITRIKQLEVVRQDFVANVSHELRTPLAIFRGYLETLQDNPGPAARGVAAHSRDDAAPLRPAQCAGGGPADADPRLEARQDGRPSSARSAWTPFSGNWCGTGATGRIPARRKSSSTFAGRHLPPLEADALRLEQVMFNLLENAVAYSNPPRRVVLFRGAA